jgi:hypothetical protein
MVGEVFSEDAGFAIKWNFPVPSYSNTSQALQR